MSVPVVGRLQQLSHWTVERGEWSGWLVAVGRGRVGCWRGQRVCGSGGARSVLLPWKDATVREELRRVAVQ